MRKQVLAGLGAALFLLALCTDVIGANIVWTNSSGGNWSTAANWSPNQVPGASDSAFLTNAGTYTVTVSTVAVASNVLIGARAARRPSR